MTRIEEETIAEWIRRILWIIVHKFRVKQIDKISSTHSAARVTRFSLFDHRRCQYTNIVSRLVNDKKYGAETALIIEFVGYIEPHFMVPSNLGSDTFGLYSFDMVDKTLPLYGTEHFKRDMSVAGEIFRRMYPMLTSPNENDRLTAARAFRVGLAALENREIDL